MNEGEDYIDTRYTALEYEGMRRRVFGGSDVSERNQDLLERFLRDCQLGKTNRHGSRKRVGKARQAALVGRLLVALRYWKKDLDRVTQDDMERFIMALESSEILSRKSGKPLSASYQANVKGALKKFYKWLLGDAKVYPDLVDWIDAREPARETHALSAKEVGRLVDGARTLRDKAFIQLLFDSGARLGELLNVRLKHVWRREYAINGQARPCYFVRLPYSKTFARTLAVPMPETEKWLSYWIEHHPAKPEIGEDGHLEGEAPLFEISSRAARGMLRALGDQMLGKRVYPHLLRHTSATYWANEQALSYVQFCTRFGWSPNSAIPRRYIYQEGLDAEGPAQRYLAARTPAEQSSNSIVGGRGQVRSADVTPSWVSEERFSNARKKAAPKKWGPPREPERKGTSFLTG